MAEETTAELNSRQNKYFFKTKEMVDEEGKPTGETFRHPDVIAVFPVPTTDELIQLLQSDEAVNKLIHDWIFDGIVAQGKQQILDWLANNPGKIFTPTEFDLSKLTLQYIASIPPSQRGAWAPDESELKSFCADYKRVMLGAVGYDPQKVAHHVKNLEKGLTKIKGDKAILRRMQELLMLYAANSEQLEEQQQTYEWFLNRIDKWLKVEEKPTIDAF